jgi:hypothetical protein
MMKFLKFYIINLVKNDMRKILRKKIKQNPILPYIAIKK